MTTVLRTDDPKALDFDIEPPGSSMFGGFFGKFSGISLVQTPPMKVLSSKTWTDGDTEPTKTYLRLECNGFVKDYFEGLEQKLIHVAKERWIEWFGSEAQGASTIEHDFVSCLGLDEARMSTTLKVSVSIKGKNATCFYRKDQKPCCAQGAKAAGSVPGGSVALMVSPEGIWMSENRIGMRIRIVQVQILEDGCDISPTTRNDVAPTPSTSLPTFAFLDDN